MNGNQNNQINTNIDVNEQYTKPQNLEPEVIGELRKDKIGKPWLVIQLFFIFGIVLLVLPILYNGFNDDDSEIYKLLHGTSGSGTKQSDTPVISSEYQDGSVVQTLSKDTSMKYGDIIMKNFILKGDKIQVTIQSYNGILDLDNSNYFLNVYSSSETLLAAVKIYGVYDNQEQSVTLQAKNLAFNNSLGYVGKIVLMSDGDFPLVNLATDESGIGSIVCKMDDRSLEYTFKNNYLIKISDEYRVKKDDTDSDDDYMIIYQKYKTKAEKLSPNALVEEVSDGFKYNASIDLETTSLPDDIDDSNYYKLDSDAKIIKYTLEGKGFDCGE